jgi:RNA polymerase sigma-70 factor, ECF subfamily
MGQTLVLVRTLSTEVEEIYRRFAPAIHRRCRAILASEEEALDALHDIFLKLYDKLSTFRGDAELMTWLYRLSTNHCLNRLREQKTRARILGAVTPVDEGRSLSAELERRDLLRVLLGSLDEEHVAIAVHYYYDEMTQPEIAKVVGLSERTVRSRIKKIEEHAKAQMLALERIGPEGEST